MSDREKDACEICKGEKGGVPGCENIVEGVTMCDYCHSNRMAERADHLEEIPDYGDLMTIKDWMASVKCGGFIDYDGHGYWATENGMSNHCVVPSDTKRKCFEIPKGMTHVVWFNK